MEKHQVELPEDERKLLAAGASQANRPAFPSDFTYGDTDFTGMPIIVHRTSVGLTKREYFAAMALQGLLSNSELLVGGSQGMTSDKAVISSYAEDAVKAADALITSLNQ